MEDLSWDRLDALVDTDPIELRNIAFSLATERAQMLNLLRDLTNPDDPCWFDHHGGCQAHGYLSLEPGQKCPHQEAKELLAAHGEQDTA